MTPTPYLIVAEVGTSFYGLGTITEYLSLAGHSYAVVWYSLSSNIAENIEAYVKARKKEYLLKGAHVVVANSSDLAEKYSLSIYNEVKAVVNPLSYLYVTDFSISEKFVHKTKMMMRFVMNMAEHSSIFSRCTSLERTNALGHCELGMTARDYLIITSQCPTNTTTTT